MEQMQVGLFPRNHYGFPLERSHYRMIFPFHDFRKEASKRGLLVSPKYEDRPLLKVQGEGSFSLTARAGTSMKMTEIYRSIFKNILTKNPMKNVKVAIPKLTIAISENLFQNGDVFGNRDIKSEYKDHYNCIKECKAEAEIVVRKNDIRKNQK